jgi:hypothetical protein
VTGGNRDTGSVVCCSQVGPGTLINTAILCQGNVKIAHGVYSGLTLQDLIKRLAEKEVPSLDGFSKYFMKPFMEEVAPNLSKVWGPWNYRDPCYFAPHATTFVFLNFLAEFGLAEIPFPIPLPVENLECKIFSWLSKGYGFELNFNLGENFTTQSTWWLLGRGTVPFFLKVPPHLIQEAFSKINYKQIVSDALLKAAKDFMTEVIPDLLKSIVEEVAVKAVALILKEVIPFKFADAPEDGESQKIEKDFEKKVLAEIREIIEESTKGEIIQAVSEVVVEIKDKIVEEAATSSDANYLCREVPGVYLYSGQSMTVGQPGNSQAALSALGFFYAEGDLKVNAQRIVGALVSRTGSIQSTGLLYFYPYFTRAALYNPKKPRDYGTGPTDDLANAFQFTPPKPEGNTCIDLFFPWARVTAAGETP